MSALSRTDLAPAQATQAPVRFALVGYGAWGRHHAAAIRQTVGAELVGIACGGERTAAAARQDHPDVPVVLDYRACLDRPDVDAADVVVPNDRHVEVATVALARGKDVLLEKPMAPTVEGCDRLLAAARHSGRVLSIGHEFRLSTQWGTIRRLLDAGELGRPLYALVSLFRFPYRPGSGEWRYDPARVGSWILEEPVHFFDLVMWYFEGLGDPTSVLAVGNPLRTDAHDARAPGHGGYRRRRRLPFRGRAGPPLRARGPKGRDRRRPADPVPPLVPRPEPPPPGAGPARTRGVTSLPPSTLSAALALGGT